MGEDKLIAEQSPTRHVSNHGRADIHPAPAQLAASVTDRDASLTDLELHVLRLSLADGRDSVADAVGPLARWRVSAQRSAKRLANPQLEALRRYAVQYRTSGGAPTSAERAAILATEYREAQIRAAEHLLQLRALDLAVRRPSQLRKGVGIASSALSMGICVWLGVAYAEQVIVFGVVGVTIASLFGRLQ